MTNINALLNHEINLVNPADFNHLANWLANLKGVRTSYHLQQYASAILHNYILWEYTGEEYIGNYTDGVEELRHYKPDQIIQVSGNRTTAYDIVSCISSTPDVKAGFKYGIKDSNKSFCLTKTQGGIVFVVFDLQGDTTFYYYGKIMLEDNKQGIKKEIFNNSGWMIRTQLDVLETPYSKIQANKISIKPFYPGEEDKHNRMRLRAGIEAIYKTFHESLLSVDLNDKVALHDLIEFSASVTEAANKILRRI